jgi:hypothetical protein
MTDQEYMERLALAVHCRRTGHYGWSRETLNGLMADKDRQSESSLWHTCGQLWTDLGQFEETLACHKHSIELMKSRGTLESHGKHFPPAALGYAQSLMRYGLFQEAMPYWEAGRLYTTWSPWPGSLYYNGEENVESLLVQSEGGYGDTFMTLRWLPLLKSVKKVKRLGLMLWKPLEHFCDWKEFGIDDIFVIDRDSVGFGIWKYAASVMSLPAVFQLKSWMDIPPPNFRPGATNATDATDATDADALLVDRHVSAGRLFRLGFCWRAEENSSPIRTKSLPVEAADRISRSFYFACNYKILSLSPFKQDIYKAAPEFRQPEYVELEPERMANWKATAEYLLSMDFVLTVDTAVAHLCGLLEVPCMVLLPKSSCWRWGTPDKQVSHWYSGQMTLYHQSEPLQWDAEDIVKASMERLDRLGLLE